MATLQQVNLYRPALGLKRRRAPLSRVQLAASVAAFAVLAWPAWEGWRIWTLQQQLREVQAQLAETQRQLTLAEQQALMEDPELRGLDEVSMRRELTDLGAQRKVWSSFVPSEDVRYSRYLKAISRRHLPGLWLTRIELNGNGAAVKLEGQSTDPALVPAFVARLGYEDVLAGVTFRGLHMVKPDDEKDAPTGQVSFVIATDPGAGAGS